MNRKQNSLMRFSRTERLAQLSEQEIVIERKKREIQAKIEAQKKKDTEEALRKLESSRDAKTNKSGFSKKPFSRSDEREKDKSVEQEKKESLLNAFSNDGSFLDQFKKLSRTGLTPGNVEVQMFARSKQDEDESKGSNYQVERSGNDRYQDKYIDRDKNDSSYLPPLDSNFQQQLPPGVNQSVPQQVPLMPPIGQNLSMVPPPLGHMPSSQSFIKNPLQLNSMSSTSSYQETPQPVPPVQSQLGGSSTMSNERMPYDHLSRIQPPLPITPQSIPPPSPIQVQNIPPPPVLSRDSDLLPKNRTESITMTLKNNTVKKLDLIPNPLDTDDATTPPPAKKPLSSVSEKKETSHLGSSHYSIPVGCSSQKEEYTRISSAFYDEDYKGDGETSDSKHRQWAEMVARCGDDFENTLRNRHENDPNLRFLFDKNSKEYVSYRKLVAKYRTNLEKSSEDEKFVKESQENEVNSGENVPSGSAREGKLSRQGSSDSDSSTKDSNADKLSRQKSETRPGNDGYQADNEEDLSYYKMPESAKKDCFIPSQRQTALKEERGENSNEAEKESSDQSRIEERRKRKRKSRWGDAVPTSSTSIGATPVTLQSSGNLPAPKTTLLSQLTRSDPGLIQYARQTFGSTNLSEEDWKKAEDHYKINLLYQDMVKKRAEIDKLERAGKFKYEYDSDEDVEGGTWEHKLRQQEMMATQLWAEELTRQAAGKHHIGDFLPPEELERFMEKYNAVKEGREPDLSDYKEFKLKQDNVGYRLLQKMGWNEGQGLGQDGSGITNPVNKATTRHENQGLGIDRPDGLEAGDDEYDAYRKRMMLAYRFRPNPLNNPRRPYY